VEIFVIMSLVAEATVAVLGLALAMARRKDIGWGIALTFGIYVCNEVIGILFFIASLSILWVVWRIYEEAK
jgi:hypothetical protein